MEEEPIAAAKAAIGSRLREERLRLGMTQADFSDFGGVAKRTALEWEQGKTSPNALFLAAASQHGIDILYVVNGVRLSDTNTAPPADEQAIVESDGASQGHRSFCLHRRCGKLHCGSRTLELDELRGLERPSHAWKRGWGPGCSSERRAGWP